MERGGKASDSERYLLDEINSTQKNAEKRFNNQDDMLASERLSKISPLPFKVDESQVFSSALVLTVHHYRKIVKTLKNRVKKMSVLTGGRST